MVETNFGQSLVRNIKWKKENIIFCIKQMKPVFKTIKIFHYFTIFMWIKHISPHLKSIITIICLDVLAFLQLSLFSACDSH